MINSCRLFLFRKNSHRKLCHDTLDDTRAISIEEFEAYVSMMHRNNNLGFSRLFETIRESSVFPANISQIECNKPKNRYMDILPCMYRYLSSMLNDHVSNF
jgi:hypothetical protein